MDQRITFDTPGELWELLNQIRQEKTKAHFILDQEGLVRESGFVHTLPPLEEGQRVVLDNGLSFALSEVIAVNGIFRSDYSEC